MTQTPSEYIKNKYKREQTFFTINSRGEGFYYPKPLIPIAMAEFEKHFPLATKVSMRGNNDPSPDWRQR